MTEQSAQVIQPITDESNPKVTVESWSKKHQREHRYEPQVSLADPLTLLQWCGPRKVLPTSAWQRRQCQLIHQQDEGADRERALVGIAKQEEHQGHQQRLGQKRQRAQQSGQAEANRPLLREGRGTVLGVVRSVRHQGHGDGEETDFRLPPEWAARPQYAVTTQSNWPNPRRIEFSPCTTSIEQS